MKLSGSKVLVTGGAGFIASHIVQDLVEIGAHITVLDNFSNGLQENLKSVANDVEVVEGDIRDYDLLKRVCRGCALVSHQAAQLEITRCMQDPLFDLRSNTEGTLQVFRAAQACGVPRVIYASSGCVYGQARTTPQTEEHERAPNWAYGVSKYATELYARLFHQDAGMQLAGLRYAIIYGPREWYGRVLTAFLKRGLLGQAPVVWGDGETVRDFTFVKDVVSLHRRIAADDHVGHDVYNVSTGIGTSVAQLAELVRKQCGIAEPCVFEDLAEGEISAHVQGRQRLPAELKSMVLDSSKAQRRFGWQPETDLRHGLQAEWEWLQAHADCWEKMRY